MIILPPFASNVTASLTRTSRFRAVSTAFILIYILATIAVTWYVLAWLPLCCGGYRISGRMVAIGRRGMPWTARPLNSLSDRPRIGGVAGSDGAQSVLGEADRLKQASRCSPWGIMPPPSAARVMGDYTPAWASRRGVGRCMRRSTTPRMTK